MFRQIRVIMLIPVFLTSGMLAQNTGATDPTVSLTNPYTSCTICAGAVWANENNANIADGIFTTAALKNYLNCFQSSCYFSRYLNCTHFNFAIPSNATVTGMALQVKRMCSAGNAAMDSTIKLGMGNVFYGSNHAALGTYWGMGNSSSSYGDSVDTWGYAWQPTDINDSTFGVFIKVLNNSNADVTAGIDNVQLTVYYLLNSGMFSQTSSPSGFNVSFTGQNLVVSFSATGQNQTLQLTNALGQIILSEKIPDSSSALFTRTINTEGMLPGIYLVSVSSETNHLARQVMILKD